MADFLGRHNKMFDNDESTGEEDAYGISGNKGEAREWSEVNRQLRKQGFQSVRVFNAQDIPVSTGGYVCLNADSNATLRGNLLTLLADCDHRQTLVHDLMEANKHLNPPHRQTLVHDLMEANKHLNPPRRQTLVYDLMEANKHLKEDVAGLTDKSDKLQSKSKDLKIMLECSRKRVQELERERDTSSVHVADEGEKGRNLRNAIHKRCRQLEEALAHKEVEADKLTKKLRVLNEEEEKRVKRQNQIFQEFKKRTARAHSLTDSKLLDIIDMYEKQLCDLKEELETTRQSGGGWQSPMEDRALYPSSGLEPTKNAKGIIKGLERQLMDADRRTKALQDEKELMSLEMSARPQLTDYRLAVQRVKKLERLLNLHNISVPGEKSSRDPFRTKRKYSTKLEDLEFLPVDLCQHYMRELCSELGVDDMVKILPEIHDMSRRLEQAGRYQELCLDLQQLVERMQDSSSRAGRPRPCSVSEDSVKHSLGIVQNWRNDMMQLQELQESLNRLLSGLAPRSKVHFTAQHSVADMTEIIDSVADDETTAVTRHSVADMTEIIDSVADDGTSAVTREGYEHVSRSTLQSMVEHFQTLFDIPSPAGVLPRMTEVYQRYGEAGNVLKTLRHLLGLAEDSNSSSVVDAVGRLCQAHNSTTSRQLQQLFETDDLGSVIRRLEEHTQFFPAFRDITCKLFDILGVERMDQIVPAVRALKLLSS